MSVNFMEPMYTVEEYMGDVLVKLAFDKNNGRKIPDSAFKKVNDAEFMKVLFDEGLGLPAAVNRLCANELPVSKYLGITYEEAKLMTDTSIFGPLTEARWINLCEHEDEYFSKVSPQELNLMRLSLKLARMRGKL